MYGLRFTNRLVLTMLQNFFQLNPGFRVFRSSQELDELLQVSKHIANILYQPDEWSPARPRNRVRDTVFENVSFTKTILRGLELQNCHFKDCLFIGATITECEFHDCTFEGCNPHKIEFRNTYIDPELFAEMLNKADHANIGVHLFQNLLRNAVATQQRAFAQSAEFYFYRWRRYQRSYEMGTGKITRAAWLKDWAPSVAFEYVAGFGLRSRYLAAWTGILVILVVAFNYASWSALGMRGPDGVGASHGIIDAVYFSLITMTTIGFGDYVPTTAFGRLAIALQGGLGVIWLGLFGATLIKRLVR